MRSLLHHVQMGPQNSGALFHRNCSLNLLRDPGMTRHMEEICRRSSPAREEQHVGLVSVARPCSRSQALDASHARNHPVVGDATKEMSDREQHSDAMPATKEDVHGVGYSEFFQGSFREKDADPLGISSSKSCETPIQCHSDDLRGLDSLSSPSTRACKADNQMLAAVDIGTNSFHMIIVKADCQGGFQIIDTEKEGIRLGSGSFGMGLITPEAEERALAAIKRFKKLAERHGAPMRAVATSAVREARNRRMFLRNILEKTGIEVEILSGKDEACLIYLGVLQALPVYDKTVLTVDIGGGSTEVVLGRAGKALYATSLKLGHVRLTELFIGNGNEPLQKGRIDELRQHVRIVLADSGVVEKIHSFGFDFAVGSSGTIETVEQMINQGCTIDLITRTDQSHTGLHGFREREFTQDELSIVVTVLCKAKNNEQRAKLIGLPERRTDVIVAGSILLEEIFHSLGIKRMRVSPYALREGVIVDTLAKTCDKYQPTPNLRWSSVLKLARRFNTEERMASASHSTHLAKQIVAGLRTCKMGVSDCVPEAAFLLVESDTELMETAVTLHHVGMFISHKDYHKHSHYLIKNNEHLVGFSPMEVEIVALLAKYHRKKVPSKKDEDFAKLPDDVQNKVRALCAIIRIAVALNRCESSAVERVHVVQHKDSCVFVIVPSLDLLTGKPQDVSFELWAAQDKLQFFEKVFSRKASIVTADHRDADLLMFDEPLCAEEDRNGVANH